MAYITWTDENGSATLSNLMSHKAARRLTNYVPDNESVSDKKTALGTGIGYEYRFRLDQIARFVMDHLPVTQAELWLRFKAYAAQGCSFFLYTEDASNRVYEVRCRPETAPTFAQSDPVLLEYAMTLEVISAATPPEPLLCYYRE